VICERKKGRSIMSSRAQVLENLAGAPISWGICEVPDWGLQLPPNRVLAEMQKVGLVATELGAAGYLGTDPEEIRELAASYGLQVIGGFVPLVLHTHDRDQLVADARQAATVLSGVGAEMFVTAVVVDQAWSARFPLSDAQWKLMFEGFTIVDEICDEFGLTQAIHPHVNTLVETADDVNRVLAGSDVLWTLDTGHLAIGGVDPVMFVKDYFDRIAHVHIKDVTGSLVDPLNAKDLSLFNATREGIFPAAGHGMIAIGEVIDALVERGYDGWYVLEQDVAITGGLPAEGAGPMLAVKDSIAFIKHHLQHHA
jgi:inosose dehydratase